VPERIDDVPVPVTVELILRGALHGRPELRGAGDDRVNVLDVDEQEGRRAGQATWVPSCGASSAMITTESPIWISAWTMVPPGPGVRMRSVAPNTAA